MSGAAAPLCILGPTDKAKLKSSQSGPAVSDPLAALQLTGPDRVHWTSLVAQEHLDVHLAI